MGYESELSKKDIQRLVNKRKSLNPIEAINKKRKKKALKEKLKKAALGVCAAGLTALAGYGTYRALKKPKNANTNNKSTNTNSTTTPAQEEIKQAKEDKANNVPPATNKDYVMRHYDQPFDAHINKWKAAQAAQQEIDQANEDKANDIPPATNKDYGHQFNSHVNKFKKMERLRADNTPAQQEIKQAKEDKANNVPPARNQKVYDHQFDSHVNKWKAAQQEIDQAKEKKAKKQKNNRKGKRRSRREFTDLNSAVDYIDNLLDTFYEAYYYDLLDDNEYEAFVESVYEADDIDEIEDIETVFESYIE